MSCETSGENAPWLTIIGLGEEGLEGLAAPLQKILAEAEIIFGGPRHLQLIGAPSNGQAWPKPFSIEPVMAARGRKIVALASGDPFWHGVGAVLAQRLRPGEWRCFSAPSTFSLAAARLGWRLEETLCLGLHAKPFVQALRHLHDRAKLIVLLADGAAPAKWAQWLTRAGFGASNLFVLERLGGGDEKIHQVVAENFPVQKFEAPVAVAVDCSGSGLARAPGLPDACFAHDGQIAKAPARALTISALGPRPGEILWDIGAGSGSISIEWALAGGQSWAIEARSGRVANIAANIENFGLSDRIQAFCGLAEENLAQWPTPDAVFLGGGASSALVDRLWERMKIGARIVVNAVTLETEELVFQASRKYGGTLMRFEVATAVALGRYHSFSPARPITQWRAVKGPS